MQNMNTTYPVTYNYQPPTYTTPSPAFFKLTQTPLTVLGKPGEVRSYKSLSLSGPNLYQRVLQYNQPVSQQDFALQMKAEGEANEAAIDVIAQRLERIEKQLNIQA